MKKKKKILFIFILILIVITIIILLTLTKNKNDNIFKNLNNYIQNNYQDYKKFYDSNQNENIDDIVDYINYCKQNSLDYTNDKLYNLYSLENFKIENLNKYENYINIKTQTNYDIVIKIVNENLDEIILNNKEITEDFLLNLINEKYYIKNNLNRYINYYLKTKLSTNEIITNVNSNIDNNFYENVEQTDTTKDTLMIVNKHYKLSDDYIPNNLVIVESDHGYGNPIRADIYEEFKKMYEAAKKDNVKIFIASPYRSISNQRELYNYYLRYDTVEKVDTYSARPGHSEHHTGLAVDLIPEFGLELDTFENSAGFKWMQENAHKYGFILRYPKDKEYITGYMYEPWHYRYVGIDAATIIKNENLTFEEYYEFYLK